jgi:hypothetical protein
MLLCLEQKFCLLRKSVGGGSGIVAFLATPSAMKLVIEGSYSLESCPFSDQKCLPKIEYASSSPAHLFKSEGGQAQVCP